MTDDRWTDTYVPYLLRYQQVTRHAGQASQLASSAIDSISISKSQTDFVSLWIITGSCLLTLVAAGSCLPVASQSVHARARYHHIVDGIHTASNVSLHRWIGVDTLSLHLTMTLNSHRFSLNYLLQQSIIHAHKLQYLSLFHTARASLHQFISYSSIYHNRLTVRHDSYLPAPYCQLYIVFNTTVSSLLCTNYLRSLDV